MEAFLAVFVGFASPLFAQTDEAPSGPTEGECSALIERASKETLPPQDADRLWKCQQPGQSLTEPHEGFMAHQPPIGDVMHGADPVVTPWVLPPEVKG